MACPLKKDKEIFIISLAILTLLSFIDGNTILTDGINTMRWLAISLGLQIK